MTINISINILKALKLFGKYVNFPQNILPKIQILKNAFGASWGGPQIRTNLKAKRYNYGINNPFFPLKKYF